MKNKATKITLISISLSLISLLCIYLYFKSTNSNGLTFGLSVILLFIPYLPAFLCFMQSLLGITSPLIARLFLIGNPSNAKNIIYKILIILYDIICILISLLYFVCIKIDIGNNITFLNFATIISIIGICYNIFLLFIQPTKSNNLENTSQYMELPNDLKSEKTDR